MAINTQGELTCYVFHGQPAAVQQAANNLRLGSRGSGGMLGGETGGGAQASMGNGGTLKKKTRRKKGIPGGTSAQHAQAGHEGGLATARQNKPGRPRKADIATTGNLSQQAQG